MIQVYSILSFVYGLLIGFLGNNSTICFASNDFLLIIIASTTVAGALVYFSYFQSFIEEHLYRVLFRAVIAESVVAVLSYIGFFAEKLFRLILFLIALILIGYIIYHMVDYFIKYRRISRGLEVVGPSLYFRVTSSIISLFLILYVSINCNDCFLCLSMLLLGVYLIGSGVKPKIIIDFYYLIMWVTPIVFLYIFHELLLGELISSLLLFIPAFLSVSILSRTFYYTTYHYSSLKALVSRPVVVVDVSRFKPHRMYNILSMVLSDFKDYSKVVFLSGYAPVFKPIVLEVMNKLGFSEKTSIFILRVQAGPLYKFRFKKYAFKKLRINETILPEDKSQIFTSINFLIGGEKKTLVFIDDLVEMVNVLGSELVYNIIRSILQKSDYGEKIAIIVFVRVDLMDLFKEDVRKLYNEIKSIATTVLKV